MTRSRTRVPLTEQLGAGLRRVREARGRSQRGQAADLGIAGNTLRELEEGTANPTLDRIERLADDLGVEVTITVEDR